MNWHEYKNKLSTALEEFTFDKEILDIFKNSIKNNQTIFIAGNGGSAGIANHYVCDISKGATNNWDTNFKRFRAICLSSNISYITAIANDSHYDQIFKQQLINLAKPKDIVVLISSSGNSPNIIEAAKYAKENNLIVIGITGFSGGKLKELAKYNAHINIESYEIAEDIHAIFGHFLANWLRNSND